MLKTVLTATILAALATATISARAQEASSINQNSKFSSCVADWRTKKAAPDYQYVKFGYRQHMSTCLKDPNSKRAQRTGKTS